MKMFCLVLLSGLALGLASCANQGPIVAYDVPAERPTVTPQGGRQGYEEPAAWVPAKYSPVRATAKSARLLFRFRKQTDELIFPQRRDGMAAVTPRFLT